MNLGELQEALSAKVLENSLESHFLTWINNAILELAADFDLPSLKTLTPVPLTLDSTNWLFDMPPDYQKKLFRCADSNFRPISRYRTLDTIDRLDIDHDRIGDHVTSVAVSEIEETINGLVVSTGKIGVYPKAAETIYLWFYRKPTPLRKPQDVPACIPEPFHDRVIVPKATIKAYEHLADQIENFDPKPLQYWQGKLAAGLRGSTAEGIGMINYLAKLQGGPRRHGGRDPVGAR